MTLPVEEIRSFKRKFVHVFDSHARDSFAAVLYSAHQRHDVRPICLDDTEKSIVRRDLLGFAHGSSLHP